MYCINCGKELDDDALFCEECGCPVDLSETADEAEAEIENANVQAPPDLLCDIDYALSASQTINLEKEPMLPAEQPTFLPSPKTGKRPLPVRGIVLAIAFFAVGMTAGWLLGSHGKETKSDTAESTPKPLYITIQPETVMAKKGEDVTFEIKAEGESLTYQWQLSDDEGANWRDSANQTAVYKTKLEEKNSGRWVRCVVSDRYGNSTESGAAVMRITPLRILTQPTSVKGKSGEKVTLTVEAQGPGLTYQWQLSDDEGKNWRDSSEVTSNYSTTLSDKNNGRYVRCVVIDHYGNRVISKAVSIKLK